MHEKSKIFVLKRSKQRLLLIMLTLPNGMVGLLVL